MKNIKIKIIAITGVIIFMYSCNHKENTPKPISNTPSEQLIIDNSKKVNIALLNSFDKVNLNYSKNARLCFGAGLGGAIGGGIGIITGIVSTV